MFIDSQPRSTGRLKDTRSELAAAFAERMSRLFRCENYQDQQTVGLRFEYS